MYSRTTKLATFPDYLLIHLKKFTVREDWTAVKLDVALDMPDYLDLNFLRGHGLQPNEELLPEVSTKPPEIKFDQNILSQLIDIVYPIEACKKALYFTQNCGADAATNWLMEHISDSDFSEPFVPPGLEETINSKYFS